MTTPLPRATYRLQLRSGMTFDRAAELVPYLADLGISHLYLSPPFKATKGSTHGYDVADANELEPELGGEPAFMRLCEALRGRGLGLILDIVPNHMGVGPDNPWWCDVLKHGRESRYARFFDIDFERDPDGKLVLPVLGGQLDEILERGELQLKRHEASGETALFYFDTPFPLRDGSTETGESADPAVLREVVEAQHYRLIFWKEGATRRNYRRFFNIDQLAGLRVEEEEVFEESHKLILDLVARGLVHGLRIDHIDGLTDPKAYLERLQRRLVEVRPDQDSEPFYLVVEKILVGEEKLPDDWPVAGTTGYEFMNEVLGWLVDPQGLEELEALRVRITGETDSYPTMARAAKRQVLDQLFAGELEVLGERAGRLLAVPAETAEAAVRELLIAFPVYRTYADANPWTPQDQDVLQRAFGTAREHAQGDAARMLDRLQGALTNPGDEKVMAFLRALQQLAGPVMAKSIEDTVFYRYPRLLPLNEVGGEPDAHGHAAERLHELWQERLAHWPGNMLATATHDTKSGEDGRARLAVLSEVPERWAEQVERWRRLNAQLHHGSSPDLHPKDEYTLYQALVGVWPPGPGAVEALDQLLDRFEGRLIKALREAKERSDWNAPDQAYEAVAVGFMRGFLDPNRSKDFLDSVADFIQSIAPAGVVNSLSQLLLKLTAPGMPDIYQGTEDWDHSLVDPDNRRPVDFGLRQERLRDARAIDALLASWPDGTVKQRLLKAGLAVRQRYPELFAEGSYEPLQVEGERSGHVLAFARRHGEQGTVTVVTRHAARLLDGESRPLVRPERWGDTAVLLPQDLHGRTFDDALTGRSIADENGRVRLGNVLAHLPVALLTTG